MRWSYQELMETPAEVIDKLIEIINEEQANKGR